MVDVVDVVVVVVVVLSINDNRQLLQTVMSTMLVT